MVWCLLRRLIYTRSAHPPNRPKTPTKPPLRGRFSSGESGIHRFYEAVRLFVRCRLLLGAVRFAGFCGLFLHRSQAVGCVPNRSLGVVSAPQAFLYSLCPPTQPPGNPHEAATSWPLLFGGERYSPLLRSREIICAVSAPARSRPLRGLLRVVFAQVAGGWVCAQSLVRCGVCSAGFFILALPTHPTAWKPPRSRHFVAASLRGRAVFTASTKP